MRVDPASISLIGDSAGGHLTALAGLTGTADNLEGHADQNVSSHVNAVAAFMGFSIWSM